MRRLLSPRVLALLALVALLAGARALVWVTTRRRDRGVGDLLLRFDPAQVAAIELQRGGDRVRLERGAAGWTVTSHGGLPAQEGAPEQLLARLRGWRVERLAGADPARHADWMVDEAGARRVRLLGADGAALAEVWVGRITGIAADIVRERGNQLRLDELGLFVRRGSPPDERTLVVNDFLTRHLDARPEVWYLRPLVRGAREQVTRVVARRPGQPPLDLRLTPAPPRIEGEPRPVDLPRAFGALSALFLLETLAPAPAPPPPDALELELEVQGLPAQTLRLWRAGERWFLAAGPLAVEVRAGDARQAAELGRREALFAREALRLVPDQVLRVHWQRGAEERSLVRRRAQPWDAVSTGAARPLRAREVAREAGAPVFEALCAWRLAGWILDPAELRLALGDQPERLVVVGSTAREELRLGPPSGGRRALSSSRLPGVGAWVEAGAVEAAWDRLRALTE